MLVLLLFTSLTFAIPSENQFSQIPRKMADCPQFQLMPQVVPIYRSQLPPPPPNAFPMQPSLPIFPIPTHFGFPPMTWSPIHHFPPPLTPPLNAYNNHQQHAEEAHEYNAQQQQMEQPMYINSNNGPSDDSLQNDTPNLSPRSAQQVYTRNVSNKVCTLTSVMYLEIFQGGCLSNIPKKFTLRTRHSQLLASHRNMDSISYNALKYNSF